MSTHVVKAFGVVTSVFQIGSHKSLVPRRPGD